MAKDPVRAIEKILGDADALIRHRLKTIAAWSRLKVGTPLELRAQTK